MSRACASWGRWARTAWKRCPPDALARRLEQSWQEVKRRPLYHQQLTQVWKQVLETIDAQADCLSREEHELVERAIVTGRDGAGSRTLAELEAARALSLRLWASIGADVGDKPYLELEKASSPARRARVCPQRSMRRVRARLS